MRPRLFTLLSAVSLLLCVATVGLWVRSYWVFDVLTHNTETRDHTVLCWILWSQQGSGAICRTVATEQTIFSPIEGWQWNTNSTANPMGALRYGFIFDRGELSASDSTSSSIRWRTIGIPFWLLEIFFAIWPSWWLLRERRRRAALREGGCCKNCGYDLRATPDRCPECGTVAAAREHVSM
ncbi:MAG TPA: hypothetical protein VH518_17090 [Tepidisphaeraceae bacterium]|jgi:hypothetical protein